MITPERFALELKQEARRLGFDLVGIAPATEADGFTQFQHWLSQGYAGTMDYLHKHEHARHHPSAVLPEVVSVVMLGMNYPATPHRDSPMDLLVDSTPMGRVARYAQGPDYHDLIRERLNDLLDWVHLHDPNCVGRGVVDTAPLLERDFARRAGLGFIGKNTMLISRTRGSYLFLSALLLDCELPIDPPETQRFCGTCTACLTACPTQAFPEPGVLDAKMY